MNARISGSLTRNISDPADAPRLVTGEHYYTCEVYVTYRRTYEIIAVDEDDAHSKAIAKLEAMAPELIEDAQVLVEVSE